MSEGLEDFVGQKLPQAEDKHLLKELIEILKKEGPESVKDKITAMTDELQKEMYLKALPVQKRMLLSSPELLVVCFRIWKPLRECKRLYDLNGFASVWACIENILLAMAAEGLHGVTYVPFETSSLKEVLDVPDGYEVAALIPIGYPKDYFVKQKQVHLKEKVHTTNGEFSPPRFGNLNHREACSLFLRRLCCLLCK